MGMIYHLLDECEPFSEFQVGAISRWVANVLRDDDDSIVVCPSADSSWGFPAERVLVLPKMLKYSRLRGRQHYPLQVKNYLIRRFLRPLIDRLKPGDVVWVQNQPDFARSLSPLVRKVGASVTLHKHSAFSTTRPDATIREIVDSVDRVIFCSEFLEVTTQKRLPGFTHSALVRNGADEELFYPPAEKPMAREVPVVLFAGRLIQEKGVHVFTAAMRLLLERGVAVEARIVGGSSYGGSKPTAYVNELIGTAPHNVQFKGYCSGQSLADEFRAADLFCCPSVWQEPFGMVNVEAMACGLPVVATNVGGIPEAFREGGGLLVEPNSPEQLAEAISTLLHNEGARKEIAREGYRSFVKNFTWSAVRDQYQQVVAAL
jgi:spore coat protein SA